VHFSVGQTGGPRRPTRFDQYIGQAIYRKEPLKA
jgi:hypothetical protein